MDIAYRHAHAVQYDMLYLSTRKSNSWFMSPDLFPDTSLKCWMYRWTREKSGWEEDAPDQLDIYTSQCSVVLCL